MCVSVCAGLGLLGQATRSVMFAPHCPPRSPPLLHPLLSLPLVSPLTPWLPLRSSPSLALPLRFSVFLLISFAFVRLDFPVFLFSLFISLFFLLLSLFYPFSSSSVFSLLIRFSSLSPLPSFLFFLLGSFSHSLFLSFSSFPLPLFLISVSLSLPLFLHTPFRRRQ